MASYLTPLSLAVGLRIESRLAVDWGWGQSGMEGRDDKGDKETLGMMNVWLG